MADFTQKTAVKSAVRELASPIADYTTFNTIIQDILDNNPWGCTAYESAGVSHTPVEMTKEGYAATIVYENAETKTALQIAVKGPTMAAVNTAVTQITGNAAITGAMGPRFQPLVTVQRIPSAECSSVMQVMGSSLWFRSNGTVSRSPATRRIPSGPHLRSGLTA